MGGFPIKNKVCEVCGDTESVAYYRWQKDDEFKDKILCNKHYTQLRNKGCLLDHEPSKHQKRNLWTKEEEILLEELYKEGKSFEEISEIMKRSIGGINAKSSELKLGDKYMRWNNPKFKAVYQDYDWCYERYINRDMSMEEMAEEAGCTLRVIQKWCAEKHRLNRNTYKELKHLTEKQRRLVMIGTLGDGHIDKRPDQPMYIESHAIDEKDYMFYKYNILKNICNNEPVYYGETYSSFSNKDKLYLCKPFYRINTRIINDFKEIREMSKIDILKNIDEWQISLLFLDDGNRSNLWQLCVAEWTKEEKDFLLKKLLEFKIRGKILKDDRYIDFDAYSSKNLDEMILKNIPNELDIIQKKILKNDKIKKYNNQFYIITDDNKVGISTYCKNNHYSYKKVKNKIKEYEYDFPEINEKDFISMMQEYKIGA